MKELAHYYNILDPKVIIEGSRVYSCLDNENPTYEESVDSETRQEEWFEATVDDIEHDYEDDDIRGIALTVYRDDWGQNPDGFHETWQIILTANNLRYIQLFIKEWDD